MSLIRGGILALTASLYAARLDENGGGAGTRYGTPLFIHATNNHGPSCLALFKHKSFMKRNPASPGDGEMAGLKISLDNTTLCRIVISSGETVRAVQTFAISMCFVIAGCSSHSTAGSQADVRRTPPAASVVYIPCCGIRAQLQDVGSNHAQDYRLRLVAFDGTGSHALRGMSWRLWNSVEAVGNGTAEVNTCEPACAGDSYSVAPVIVTLSAAQECGSTWFWSKATWHFPGSNPPPGEFRDETFTFSC